MRARRRPFIVMLWAAVLLLPLTSPAPARADGPLAPPVLHQPQPTGISGYSVNLSWVRVPDAASYRVRVRFDGYDADYFDQRTVNDQILLWAVTGTATFAWTVTAVSADGLEGVPASARYDFQPKAPELLGPAEGAVLNMPDDGVEFRWRGGYNSAVHWDQQPDGSPWTWPSGGAAGSGGKAWGWLPVGVSRWYVSSLGPYDAAPRPAPSEIRNVTVAWNNATPQVDDVRSETTANAGETVRLAWNPVPGAAAYIVQFVGADQAFPDPTPGMVEYGTVRDISVPWAATYKWRVAAIPSGAAVVIPDAFGPWSATRTVSVRNACAGARITSPADGAVLDSFPLLRWESDGCSATVEIAGNRVMLGAAQRYPTNLSAMAVPAPLTGGELAGDVTIHWRVVADDDPPWRSFTVHQGDAPSLAQPVAATRLGPADCPDAVTCEPIEGLPVLRWAPVDGAGSYRVFLWNPDGTGVGRVDVFGTEVQAPISDWWWDASTWHRWAVVACNSTATCRDEFPADYWTFGTALPAPALSGPASVVESGPAATVAWTPAALTSDPDVLSVGWGSELAVEPISTPVGPTVSRSTVVGRNRAWFGGMGDLTTFRWRVRSTGYGVRGAWSDWQEVRVQAPPITLLTPADGATAGPSPVLRWQPVQDTVTGYYVSVTREEDANRPGWSGVDFGGWVNGASWVPSPALPPGHYTWTVRRSSAHNLGTPVSTGHFTVPGDAGVTLLAPGAGDTVTSNGAVFSWAPVAGAGSYWILVGTDPSMAWDRVVAEGWTDATQYAVAKELPDGPLYWMVCANLPDFGSAACSPVASAGGALQSAPTAQPGRLAAPATAGSASPIAASEVRAVVVQGRAGQTPGAPTRVTATPGAGQALVFWSAPASDGGSAITGYTATSSPGGRTCATTGATSCAVTGLANGTAYTFTVTATNAGGKSSPSASSAPVTPATRPGSPSGVAGAPEGSTVHISWSAPASNGGAAVATYKATLSPGGKTCTATSLACDVTAVSDGTYTATVTATNWAGTSDSSGASSPILVDASVPGASFRAPATPTNAASLEYAVLFTEPVTGFVASDLSVTGTAAGCTVGEPAGAGASWTVSLKGCAEGTVVLALASGSVIDADGELGPPALASASSVRIDRTAPTTPTLAVVPRTGASVSGSSLSLSLSWTAATDAGSGLAATPYELRVSANGGAWAPVTTTAARSASLTARASGTVRYQVRARDAAGNPGAWRLSPTLSPRLVQQTSTAISYGGRWSTSASPSFSGGSARYASVSGRSASYKFTGRSVALVTTRAAKRGKVKLYLDGRYILTVDLYRSTTQYRTVVWQKSWSSSGTHIVKLVVAGTSGRPRVDLDAFMVVK